jgi:hypothetical protein
MLIKEEHHGLLEKEAAASSMRTYRVDFLCPACGEYHGACPHLQFKDGPDRTGSVADLFAGVLVPRPVTQEMHSVIVCPRTHETVSMNDPLRVFLTPSWDI